MADNNRIFYAIQQVAIGQESNNAYYILKGVQSVSKEYTPLLIHKLKSRSNCALI